MALADVLCPDRCVACSALVTRPPGLPLATPAGWCDGCAATVVPLERPFCLDCAPAARQRSCPAGQHLRVRAAVQYGEAVAALVRQTKYERRSALTAVWGRAWQAVHGDALGREEGAEGMVPVPLHPARIRERGFDVVAGWGEQLARSGGVPLLRGLLRVRPTPQQVGQSRRRRIANVAGAFAPGPEWKAVAGRRLLLVDDVVTTGATVREAAAVLRSLGAAEVRVWCFAFEPLE